MDLDGERERDGLRDREDEEDARARELVGYVDLRETPFDVHAELKISKDNSNPAGRARAGARRYC